MRGTVQVGDAKVELETGRIARQADGAVVARQGKAFLLATVVAGAEQDRDMVPLTVHYREMHAAAGRIPGNFLRRETRQNEHEILTSRLIDRMLRPLLPKTFRRTIQVTITVYSVDPAADITTLALIAAGATMQVSGLPFAGPVAGMRVTRTEAGLQLPGAGAAKNADLDVVVAATANGVTMLEGTAQQVQDIDVFLAVESARGALDDALQAIAELGTAAEAEPVATSASNPADIETILSQFGDPLRAAVSAPDKWARDQGLDTVRAAAAALGPDAAAAVNPAMRQLLRAEAVNGRRMGGRGLDEVRAISCEAGLLGANHGSALFTRGDTQVLVSATLGNHRDARDFERVEGNFKERFLLHYNFPAFAVGEAGAPRAPGRRELGHGRLAQRALAAVMPAQGAFPYVVRVVSDVTESDGSSSMATVCGASLAMINAGVPLVAPVAGVAMGLLHQDDRWVVLTDITGDEDQLGDMDFKVAGTSTGITALQLDTKLEAVPTTVIAEALAAAGAARKHILEAMAPTLESQRGTPAASAPKHTKVKINPSRVGALIGQGGRNLKQLQSKTKTKIEVNQDGTVQIYGPSTEAVEAAAQAVRGVSVELRKGGLYQGTITQLRGFGAFVRVGEHESLIHISELAAEPVEDPATVVKVGDQVLIKVLGADAKGRLRLSRKAALGADPAEALNA